MGSVLPFPHNNSLGVTLKAEVSRYFRIGENKLQKLAEENKHANWLNRNCNRIQIKRKQFEKIIDKLDAIL